MLQGARAWESRHNKTFLHLLIDITLSITFLPSCLFIFAIEVSVITAVDILGSVRGSAPGLDNEAPEARSNEENSSMLSESSTDDDSRQQEAGKQHDQADSGDDATPSIDLALKNKHLNNIFQTLFRWLQSPPRPLKKYRRVKSKALATTKEAEAKAHLQESDQ